MARLNNTTILYGLPVLCSLLCSLCVYWNGKMKRIHEEELRALEVNSSM